MRRSRQRPGAALALLQQGVDARLPARAGRLETLDHVSIEPQGHRDLAIGFRRAPDAPNDAFDRL